MKEFIVSIDRVVYSNRVLTIKAENEEQARNAAMDIASENKGWEDTEYDTNYKVRMEEVPNNYIDQYGHPYDSNIEKYLFSKGFLRLECREDWEQWVKGNTQIDYECYDKGAHLWGYMHTELIDID